MSERLLRRALELNPSLAVAHTHFGWHLLSRGRHEEALDAVRSAVALDPLSFVTRRNPAAFCHYAGRYDDALGELQRGVLAFDPAFAPPILGWIYEALSRHADAIGAYEKAGALSPERVSALRTAFSERGAQGYWLEMLVILRSRRVPLHVQLAGIHARLGEREEAFAELERAYAAREGDLVWLRTFPPGLDPIRDDPRFADLVRRIGIPDR